MAAKLLSLLLPGIWHVLSDRCKAGVGIFAAWAAGLNGFFLWPFAFGPHGAGWRYGLLAVAAVAWAFSAAEAFRKGAPHKPPCRDRSASL